MCNSVAALHLPAGHRQQTQRHVHALPLMSLLCFGCGSYCTSSSGAVEWGRWWAWGVGGGGGGQDCDEGGEMTGDRQVSVVNDSHLSNPASVLDIEHSRAGFELPTQSQ